jgi:uncharacterized lipoprotein YmbA
LLGAALLIAACGSSPVRYYTLATPRSASTTPSTNYQIAVNVDSVRIPERINQPQIIVRQSNQELAMLENARWASPLSNELSDALSADVVAQLGAKDMRGLPQAHAATTYVIDVNVSQMDGTFGGAAVLDASWTVKFHEQTWSCNLSMADLAGSDLSSLVSAYQRMVARLAGGIATSVQTGKGAEHCAAAR